MLDVGNGCHQATARSPTTIFKKRACCAAAKESDDAETCEANRSGYKE